MSLIRSAVWMMWPSADKGLGWSPPTMMLNWSLNSWDGLLEETSWFSDASFLAKRIMPDQLVSTSKTPMQTSELEKFWRGFSSRQCEQQHLQTECTIAFLWINMCPPIWLFWETQKSHSKRQCMFFWKQLIATELWGFAQNVKQWFILEKCAHPSKIFFRWSKFWTQVCVVELDVTCCTLFVDSEDACLWKLWICVALSCVGNHQWQQTTQSGSAMPHFLFGRADCTWFGDGGVMFSFNWNESTKTKHEMFVHVFQMKMRFAQNLVC